MDRRELMTAGVAVAVTATLASAAKAAASYGMTKGAPDIKSVGPLAFGPAGVLFVADPVGAKVFALDVGAGRAMAAQPVSIDKLDMRLAAFLGAAPADIAVRDVAVQPGSNIVFISVMRGSGAAAVPALVKIDAKGELSQVALTNIAFAQTTVEKAPGLDDKRTAGRQPLRSVTVTDLAYTDGTVLIAGASNEEFTSAFRRVAFPFNGAAQLNSLEIFHVSHGRFETASPITSFVPYGGAGSVLAAYTCTPLVQFSLTGAAAGSQVKGKSVADLGPGSTPTDMLHFRQGGEDYFLVANSRHPLMKVARRDIDKQEALIKQADHVGAARKELPQAGVSRLANLGDGHVLMMQQDPAAGLSLRSYAVETL